jgi:hypothetical protein
LLTIFAAFPEENSNQTSLFAVVMEAFCRFVLQSLTSKYYSKKHCTKDMDVIIKALSGQQKKMDFLLPMFFFSNPDFIWSIT